MNLNYQENGNLVDGIFVLSIEEFEEIFGYNEHRRELIKGLKLGLDDLKQCGCSSVYIDGSFCTKKELPNDFDACWDMENVDLEKLQANFPTIIDFLNARENQKKKYLGEFFPAQFNASPMDIYLDFFQKDREGNKKGIIKIDLK